MTTIAGKGALREAMLNGRAERTPDGDAARDELLRRKLSGFTGVIACYASIPGEPSTTELISWLSARCRVLLPVLRRQPDWSWFTSWDQMRPAWRGIPEPTGPRLGAEALALADLVLCPALAVGRDGTRLGTGGGWYDRALPHRRPGVEVWCLVSDSEILATLPAEDHDQRVDAAVTESGITRLTR